MKAKCIPSPASGQLMSALYLPAIVVRSPVPSAKLCISDGRRQHEQNVNQLGSMTQSSQILWVTSPVLLSTSGCSQIPLELSKVLSDSAREYSSAVKSSCSYGGAFRMLQDLTYRIVKYSSFWDLCADLWQTSTEAETAAQLCGRLRALFSHQGFLHNQKVFRLIIFVFVTVTRLDTS
jgi:hypothetical protein